MSLLHRCILYAKLASIPVFYVSQLRIDPSGMRDESFDLVRSQRKSKQKMRPVEIDIYPDQKPFLSDGRHRVAIAKELGDESLNAIVREYDDDAHVINKYEAKLILN